MTVGCDPAFNFPCQFMDNIDFVVYNIHGQSLLAEKQLDFLTHKMKSLLEQLSRSLGVVAEPGPSVIGHADSVGASVTYNTTVHNDCKTQVNTLISNDFYLFIYANVYTFLVLA